MENVEKKWYVVNTYSGHENKVKINLERRIETMDMQDYIFRVVVAEHPVPVLKDGLPTDKIKMKNTYPGYLFIEMIMTDEAWYVVRNTPGVTGFIGSSGRGAKPFPVPKEQIESVLKGIGVVEAIDPAKGRIQIRFASGSRTLSLAHCLSKGLLFTEEIFDSNL